MLNPPTKYGTTPVVVNDQAHDDPMSVDEPDGSTEISGVVWRHTDRPGRSSMGFRLRIVGFRITVRVGGAVVVAVGIWSALGWPIG